jgi:hypothetical protein
MDYDADHAPDPEAWLAASEGERFEAVERHHTGLSEHARTPKPRLHAALHQVVENQLALDQPPEARRALARLIAGGLPRHEAIHALGLLVANATAAALEGKTYDPATHARELDALTVERWKSLGRE